jgi:hypothetical protein
VTNNDDSRLELAAQSAGMPREEHAADGSVQAAAGYVTVKALGKVFGGRDSGKGGDSGPPSDPPSAQTK